MTTTTREELLKLAKEAGGFTSVHYAVAFYEEHLERFAALLCAHQAQGGHKS